MILARIFAPPPPSCELISYGEAPVETYGTEQTGLDCDDIFYDSTGAN